MPGEASFAGEPRGRRAQRGWRSHVADKVKITCTNNDRVVDAQVVQRSLKRLVVSFAAPGAGTMELVLTRDDPTKPFVGRLAGMEFTAPAGS